jgi:hypothetical protein
MVSVPSGWNCEYGEASLSKILLFARLMVSQPRRSQSGCVIKIFCIMSLHLCFWVLKTLGMKRSITQVNL